MSRISNGCKAISGLEKEAPDSIERRTRGFEEREETASIGREKVKHVGHVILMWAIRSEVKRSTIEVDREDRGKGAHIGQVTVVQLMHPISSSAVGFEGGDQQSRMSP